jgi:pyrroloquinoline quinone biosynthesis protein E
VDKKNNCFLSPKIINIELTTQCPFNCPQCYKIGQNSKDITLPFERLETLLIEATSIGTKIILLSGGEPLLYPNIEATIKLIKRLNMDVYMSTSGYGLIAEKALTLKKEGLDILYVSLNGSTDEINHASREGYFYALNALKIARSVKLRTRINWVARHDNVKDLEKMIELIKLNEVEGIDILRNKINREGIIKEKLTLEDLKYIASLIKAQDKPNFMVVESCFFELKILLGINIKNIVLRGCSAGRYSMAIDAQGMFMPCSHALFKKERYDSILKYWRESQILNEFRRMNFSWEPCTSCIYNESCTPCQAEYECKECYIYKKKEIN